MADPTDTFVRIRAQALGGKFLADDIGGAEVTVRDVQSGKVLATGFTRGTDSGQLVEAWQPGASLHAIVNPELSQPQIVWVVAGTQTSNYEAPVAIDRPTLVEITAFGPVGGLQSAQPSTVRQWVIPGTDFSDPPGVVVVIPGLMVQVMNPPTHSVAKAGGTISLEANVTMICGCPIERPPEKSNGVPPPWTPANFDVFALVRRLDENQVPGEPNPQHVPMHFDEPNSPSRFCGEFTIPSDGGFYEATITAVQKNVANLVAGKVTFFVKPGA